MVIYHGITAWHILECWVHKLVYHKNEDAVLILPDFILEKFPHITETFPREIFNIRIIRYMKLNFNLDEARFEEELRKIVESLSIGKICADDEIYIAGGQYMFSHYLIKRSIPFHFFEEAPGRLTTAEIVMGNVKKINRKQYDIAVNDGMFVGNSSMVKKIICNVSAQAEGHELPENIEDLDVIDCMRNLEKNDLQLIKDFFDVPEVSFKEKSAMILTQHFANLEMTTYIQQALLYQMTIDYFLEDHYIYIKPHPDDLMSYKSELTNAEVINGCFPSELLHVISDRKVSKLLAISSSSILNLKKYYDDIIEFNEKYLETFYFNHQYYLAAKIIEKVGLNKKISGTGINFVQFNHMLDVVCKGKEHIRCMENLKTADIRFIGSDADIDEISRFCGNKGIYMFLDPDTWFKFAKTKKKCMNNSICKKIILKAMYEEYEEGIFYLYIYCENAKIRKEIADMYYVKELINTGIETTVPRTDDKDIEIAVLKGILKATENRLEFYIKQENKQNNEG